MKLFGREIEGYGKALLVLAAIFLVSSGLCGVTVSMEGKGGFLNLPNNAWGQFLGIAGLVEFGAMIISGGGIVLVAIAWMVTVVYGLTAKPPKDRVQKLFDDKDETKNQ